MPQQLNAIVKDSVPFPVYVSESRYLTKQYALEEINNDTALMLGDTILQNFNANLIPTNMGKIFKTMQYMGQGNFVSADAVNNSISPNNTIEQYHKAVNYIYMHTIAAGVDSATPAELAILVNIAKHCPLVDGRAVFIARSMLNYFLHTSLTFNDSTCNGADTNEDNRVLANTETNLNGNPNVLVYPNPANTLLNIAMQLPQGDKAQICLFNNLGQLVQCVQ